MYQAHAEYTTPEEFDSWLDQLEERFAQNPPVAYLFHLFNASDDITRADAPATAIRKRFPQAAYLGASANGSICGGGYTGDRSPVAVACDVFEDPDTRIELLQLPLDYSCQEQTARDLLDAIDERPWVTAVEMLTTLGEVNLPVFCGEISRMPEDIVFFGGGSSSVDTNPAHSAVLSSAGPLTTHGAVFALYGGRNLHATTMAIQGWRPLGLPFRITRAERAVLHELNGTPAYDTYHRYLNIDNDENFTWNGLLFPLSIDHDGMQILRTPLVSNPDGSLIMTADITGERNECRIAYGDPSTIAHEVESSARAMNEFQPQVILMFSCASRLRYWGEFVSRETAPFQAVAPMAGFFTGSEFIRHGGDVVQHNVTLVVVGLREGDPDPSATSHRTAAPQRAERKFNLQLAIIDRMASFIGAASQELQEAYDNMERMARTDGLTGLADRRETERLLIEALQERAGDAGTPDNAEAPTLIMLDLDGFKDVNDTYGHETGDAVLRGLADLMKRVSRESQMECTPGRWGGEEFMMVLRSCTLNDAYQLAESLRLAFADLAFERVGHCTMCLGVAQARPHETFDRLCSRVDHAMYDAKYGGKNRTVVAE